MSTKKHNHSVNKAKSTPTIKWDVVDAIRQIAANYSSTDDVLQHVTFTKGKKLTLKVEGSTNKATKMNATEVRFIKSILGGIFAGASTEDIVLGISRKNAENIFATEEVIVTFGGEETVPEKTVPVAEPDATETLDEAINRIKNEGPKTIDEVEITETPTETAPEETLDEAINRIKTGWSDRIDAGLTMAIGTTIAMFKNIEHVKEEIPENALNEIMNVSNVDSRADVYALMSAIGQLYFTDDRVHKATDAVLEREFLKQVIREKSLKCINVDLKYWDVHHVLMSKYFKATNKVNAISKDEIADIIKTAMAGAVVENVIASVESAEAK